ncbi:MAG: NADH-quinone oxidoreductase subunit L [Candidatus Omnitrophica bacterium]|nr:NADH-quinone oxidoreductase subunit L [Candidatus Omnitrophota bacterium]
MPLLLIPALPLVSFLVLILAGRRLGTFAPAVSLAALGGSALLSIQTFRTLLATHEPLRVSWAWLPGGREPIVMGFLADPLSATMLLVVTVVGSLIMLYSTGYMHGDARYSRFFAYLSLFCCAMLTLVLADHFILLYIGWELVGLCSYLLISFWFEKESAANAGKKAFLTTRVGDLGLLGAIFLIAWVTGDLSFSHLAGKAQALGGWGPLVAILIFWGAAGKSAQFPLHVWLPDAMEGPTPVSALIHAATMVAAGVYLVARTMPLFLPNPESLLVVGTLAAITSFFAATVACTQTDLKKILAYSTISQLGFMMLGMGAGAAPAGMFHLVTHAWFKALLFLGAGSVIHAVHHQDVTRMGGLWKAMPVTAATFIIASIAMAGIPPLSGFWSKEGILAAVAESLPAPFLYIGLTIAFLTAFYITRAVILVFFGTWHQTANRYQVPNHPSVPGTESPAVMTGPLVVLSIGAAGIGLLGSPWTGHAFQKFLESVPGTLYPVQHLGSVPGTELAHHAAEAAHHGPAWLELGSVAVAAAGILLALLRYGLGRHLLPESLRAPLRPLYHLVAGKYFIDELYETVLLRPARALARIAFSFDARVVDGAVNGAGAAGLLASRVKAWVDNRIVDGLVNGVAIVTGRAGAVLRLLQTGRVQNYLLLASAAAVVIFFFLKGAS